MIYLGKNKIYDHCEDSSEVFSINPDGLKNECLRQKNYKTLFYIEGNSHTAQFIPIFNKLSFLDNVYYKHATDYNISVNQVNKLIDKFFGAFTYFFVISNKNRALESCEW